LRKKDTEKTEKVKIEHDEEKPDILVLHTGGTIASRVSYEEGVSNLHSTLKIS